MHLMLSLSTDPWICHISSRVQVCTDRNGNAESPSPRAGGPTGMEPSLGYFFDLPVLFVSASVPLLLFLYPSLLSGTIPGHLVTRFWPVWSLRVFIVYQNEGP